jgi:hypothetical protein
MENASALALSDIINKKTKAINPMMQAIDAIASLEVFGFWLCAFVSVSLILFSLPKFSTEHL